MAQFLRIIAPLKDELIIPPETPLTEGLKRMSQNDAARLLVMRGDRMVGMITQTGLLRFLEIKRTLAA